MIRIRFWLRRHLWFWWTFSGVVAGADALMFGLLLAGYRVPFDAELIWAAVPVVNFLAVWWLTSEAATFRDILTAQLRQDA